MATDPVIAPIVEGHGEVLAVRDLVTRIGLELLGGTWIEVAQPFRLDSGKMRQPGELAKAIRIAGARVRGRGGAVADEQKSQSTTQGSIMRDCGTISLWRDPADRNPQASRSKGIPPQIESHEGE